MKSETSSTSRVGGADRSALWRAVGLILIGLGGLAAGSGLPLVTWLAALGEVSPSVIAGIGAAVAMIGILVGGMHGMAVFAIGNVLMGAGWFEGGGPSWIVGVGAPFIMVGMGLRLFNE